MRAIAMDFFSRSPYMAGPLVAMLIFLVVFAVVIVRIALRGESKYAEAASLPLADDEVSTKEVGS